MLELILSDFHVKLLLTLPLLLQCRLYQIPNRLFLLLLYLMQLSLSILKLHISLTLQLSLELLIREWLLALLKSVNIL